MHRKAKLTPFGRWLLVDRALVQEAWDSRHKTGRRKFGR